MGRENLDAARVICGGVHGHVACAQGIFVERAGRWEVESTDGDAGAEGRPWMGKRMGAFGDVGHGEIFDCCDFREILGAGEKKKKDMCRAARANNIDHAACADSCMTSREFFTDSVFREAVGVALLAFPYRLASVAMYGTADSSGEARWFKAGFRCAFPARELRDNWRTPRKSVTLGTGRGFSAVGRGTWLQRLCRGGRPGGGHLREDYFEISRFEAATRLMRV